jgi:glucose/arabinose dehydrogenase
LAALELPTAVAPLGGGELLVTQKAKGVVRVALDGSVTDVVDLSNDLSVESERGVLGVAIQPDREAAFVAYTAADGAFTVERLVLPITGEVTTREEVLSYPDAHRYHNGGQLAFGPDGMLYIGMGDGGDETILGDPNDDAQSLGTLFGKILRIDVTSEPGQYEVPPDNPFAGQAGRRGEIWAYGLRNPWRFAFDGDTGDLWVSDVGHVCWEEVDRLPAASPSGANLGWSRYEAGYELRPGHDPPEDVLWPLYQYRHVPGPKGAEVEGDHPLCGIIGGGVYRGAAIPDLQGWYVYSDYCARTVFALDASTGSEVKVAELTETTDPVISLGSDQDGEVLILTTGGLSRMVPGA